MLNYPFLLNVIMLDVVMPSVIMLDVIMLSVIMLDVILLSVAGCINAVWHCAGCR